MAPDELLEQLWQHYGVRVGRSTLARWASTGLVPRPTVKALGRGRGTASEYPPEALADAWAAAFLLRQDGVRPAVVAQARRYATRAYHLDPLLRAVGMTAKAWVALDELRRAADAARVALPEEVAELLTDCNGPAGTPILPWVQRWLHVRNLPGPGPFHGPARRAVLGFARQPDGVWRLDLRREG